MEMLVRETLEVVDLEIIDPENGVDFTQPGWDADPEGLRAYIDALRQMVEEAEEE